MPSANAAPPVTPQERARAELAHAGACPPRDVVLALTEELQGELEHALARKLLERALSRYPDDVELTQRLALCTYKDEELLPSRRFADALALLERIGLGAPDAVDPAKVPATTIAETLALGGAVYKRMFEQEGRLEHLHQALALYEAAWRRDPAKDLGHGGVNAAYALDLLASRAETLAARTGTPTGEATGLRERARRVRREMAAQLASAAEGDPGLRAKYWYAVTVAEIQFGLEEYERAGEWLERAGGLDAREWQRQATFRQLASLARLQGHIPPREGLAPDTWPEAWRALRRFLGAGADRAFGCWRGKVGLALSGGGFRASLFHLGVLARLAETDILRAVEVMSTVSGGSIVGAHYYLELKRLLETRPDTDISREDYVALVRRVQQDLFAGVQRNLRTRVLTSLGANLRMLVPRWAGLRPYTRSHRMGELYERELYGSVADGHPAGAPRRMPELLVRPPGVQNARDFRPRFANWRRGAKVPVLLLNTTSLNSGHSWHFTASWMGEPPGVVGEGVDANARYRRLYYGQAPTTELRGYRLGYAVAASACVPGLFDPLVLRGLYAGRTVRLVDGGVHDNQGVQALLDEGCTFVLCSDASGQMSDDPTPPDGMLGVPLRANSVLMDRVREAEYQDLRTRADSGALQGLFFIHLKQGLAPSPIDWIDCQDPHTEPSRPNQTPYGIDREIQARLAAIRTDLDTFTEVEAYALMLSGYRMTEHELQVLDGEYRRSGGRGTWGGFDVSARRGDWPFLSLEAIAGKAADSSDLRRVDLERQLRVGASRAFKAWRLSPWLQAAGVGAVAGAGAAIAWMLYRFWNTPVATSVGSIVIALAAAIAGALVPAVKLLDPQRAMRAWLMNAGLALVGWIGSNLHVWLIDPIYRRRGRLDRLLRLPAA